MKRRMFLKQGLLGAAGAVFGAGCDSGSAPPPAAAVGGAPGPVGSTETPEVSALRFGMIALTDCSPLVIAHEKGFCTSWIRRHRLAFPCPEP